MAPRGGQPAAPALFRTDSVLCTFYFCFQNDLSPVISFHKSHESCELVLGTPEHGEDLQLAGLGSPHTVLEEGPDLVNWLQITCTITSLTSGPVDPRPFPWCL